MKQIIVYHRPEAKQIPGISQQVLAFYQEAFDHMPHIARDWLERGLASPRLYLFFLLDEKQVVLAAATFQLLADEGELLHFAVSPQRRRQGLGAFLLAQALVHLEEQGLTRCFLEVRAHNIPAQALYESQRFKCIDQRKNYYQDNHEDAKVYLWERSTSDNNIGNRIKLWRNRCSNRYWWQRDEV